MRKRSVLVRAGAVVAGASLAVLSAALPASADEASGRLIQSHDTGGHRVNIEGKDKSLSTALLGLKLDGGSMLHMYCVEINVRIDRGQDMVETPWDEYPNEDSPFHDNREKINWVLQHGYPAVDVDALEQQLTENGSNLNNGLDKREAIAGTQAAVWHFSDAKELNKKSPVPHDKEAGEDVAALYDFLTDGKLEVEGEPAPTLDLSPAEATGDAGERIGPFTVSTTGEITELNSDLPDGAKLTDVDGNELAMSDVADGTDIYVDVPEDAADGNGEFSIKANGHVNTGRLFVGAKYDDKKAQSLIVAQSEKTDLTAAATASWKGAPATTAPPEETTTTAPPTSTTTSNAVAPPATETPVNPQADSGPLAQTGVSALTPILIGAGLVIAGAAALLLQRRRKNTA
ncbi:Cys-Gln thioester bond-forming surface protein [Qaidamihabitans albus]|uniref:Cys-Gln thioester bond-forming surface protein n=1 Tax=Qaidamihabitans albus TaxID=2795733 RepID=UPI0018F23205|nr:Cys-Gln thioester bond-forming surface protein [Qaidamihabitans albus]